MGPLSFNDFVNKIKINEEEEGRMYLQDLQEISSIAAELRELMAPEEDLEAWVQDKITIAHHNMDAILGYYKSKEKGGTNSTSQGGVTSTNLLNT